MSLATFAWLWQKLRGRSASVPIVGGSSASSLTDARETDAVDALVRRGVAHIAQQQYQDAEHCIAALEHMNAAARIDYLRARLALAQGRESDAFVLLESAISRDPADSASYTEAGELARGRGDIDEAEYFLSQAVHYEPGNARARVALGQLLASQKRFDAALQQFAAAVSAQPDDVDLLQHLVNIYWERGELPAVAAAYQQALRVAPDNFDLHLRLANCWREMGELDAARRHILHALALRPRHRTATLSYAQLLVLLGDPRSALEHVQALLDAHPGDVLVHWTMALVLLKEGRFAEAWPHHEIGLPQRLQNNRFGESKKPWHGESLAGKRVLIYGEQGLGDEIMFASCIPDVLRQASACVIECAPKLEKLFALSFPSALIHAGQERERRDWLERCGPIDYEIPSGTLPSVFRRAAEDFPVEPYLQVPQEVRDKWRRRLVALGPGLNVGISWRGGTKTTGIYARSIPLEHWIPILTVPGVNFVNLQYNDCAAEIQAATQSTGSTITTWQDALDDYAETAALVTALDLVITVCTSIVFVASGLGRPVWVMAPPGASWRYVRAQSHTPWAPTAEIFWQQGGSWSDVISDVADRLARRLHQS